MNDRIRQGLGTLNETARNMTRDANGGGVNSLSETARDMNYVYGIPGIERWGPIAEILSQFAPVRWKEDRPSEFKWTDDSVRFPFSLTERETDRGFDPKTGKWVERGQYTPSEYRAPEYALEYMPIVQAAKNLQSAYIKHLITPGQFERVVNIIKGAPSAIGNALIGQWAAMGADPGTAAKHPVTGEPEYGASLLPFGRAAAVSKSVSKDLAPRTEMITPGGFSFPVPTMQMTQGGDEPSSLPSEKLLATTPERDPAGFFNKSELVIQKATLSRATGQKWQQFFLDKGVKKIRTGMVLVFRTSLIRH